MDLITVIGLAIITLGAILDVIAAIGLLRFPDYYTRMHAATIGAIGGAVLPIIGVAILAISLEEMGGQRFAIFSSCIVVAITLFIVAPVAIHAVARASYRSGEAKPYVLLMDGLKEKERRHEV